MTSASSRKRSIPGPVRRSGIFLRDLRTSGSLTRRCRSNGESSSAGIGRKALELSHELVRLVVSKFRRNHRPHHLCCRDAVATTHENEFPLHPRNDVRAQSRSCQRRWIGCALAQRLDGGTSLHCSLSYLGTGYVVDRTH